VEIRGRKEGRNGRISDDYLSIASAYSSEKASFLHSFVPFHSIPSSIPQFNNHVRCKAEADEEADANAILESPAWRTFTSPEKRETFPNFSFIYLFFFNKSPRLESWYIILAYLSVLYILIYLFMDINIRCFYYLSWLPGLLGYFCIRYR